MQTVSLTSVFLQSEIPNKWQESLCPRLGFAQTEPPRGPFPSTLYAPWMCDARDANPGSPDPRAGLCRVSNPQVWAWLSAWGGPRRLWTASRVPEWPAPHAQGAEAVRKWPQQ